MFAEDEEGADFAEGNISFDEVNFSYPTRPEKEVNAVFTLRVQLQVYKTYGN